MKGGGARAWSKPAWLRPGVAAHLETSPGTNVAKRQIRWSHGALAGARGSHAGFLGWNWNRTSPPVRSAMAGTVSPSFRVPAARVCRSAVHLGAVVGDVKAGHGAPLPSRPYRVATRLCVIEPDSASRNTTARPNRLSSLNLDCCLRIERLSVTQGWTVNEIPSTPGR